MSAASPVEEFLQRLQADPDYADQIMHLAERRGRRAAYGQLPVQPSPPVAEILRRQGLDRPYLHQVQALQEIFAGSNVVIAAGTAAGKTLCYILPIAQALAEDLTTRSLLLYPTKALAQDQLRKLADFGAGQTFVADTYDGDTPPPRRRQIRRQAQVVLSNPDMLHVGMLPHHGYWAEFFRNLRYVVIDEVHVYRGVFGSHVANVLRRLRRICDYYGSCPQFIASSATIGNPGELCQQLTGLPFAVVDQDTAPRGRQFSVFWNPPLLDPELGRRRSTNREAAELMARLVRSGIRTLTFTLSRMQAELILRYTRELLADDPDLQSRIAPYRGGYLPEERRRIEAQLFSGELLGAVATSALELGIDIGGLDAVITVGFPGTVASVRQQSGRAGRARQDALAFLLAVSGGIDQYIMEHPEFILAASHEQARCHPGNRFILGAHLLCAAYELPLDTSDLEYFGEEMEGILGVLTENGLLDKRRRWYWADPEVYPAGEFSLRSGSGQGYDIVLAKENRLLGTVDESSAFWLVHPGAIYLHAGESYLVEDLDLQRRQATVIEKQVNYYTRPMSTSEVRIAEAYQQRSLAGGTIAHLGEIVVQSQIIGYRKLHQRTDKELDIVPLDLPENDFETVGLWLTCGDQIPQLKEHGYDPFGSLHALEHALIGLLPLFVMCDPHDVGGASYPLHADTSEPTVFLYDGHLGGVGLSEQAYENFETILEATAERIEKCPCAAGCPACVQSPSCGDNNQPLDKDGAAGLARMMLGKGAAGRP